MKLTDLETQSSLHIDIRVDFQTWSDVADWQILTRKIFNLSENIAQLRYIDGSEISFLFCDDKTIADLNRQYRNANGPTNVLSFPCDPITKGVAGPMIGDVALAYEIIRREAENSSRSILHHTHHLIVHGILHLFGYDHIVASDAEAMQSLETQILSAMSISDPYMDN